MTQALEKRALAPEKPSQKLLDQLSDLAKANDLASKEAVQDFRDHYGLNIYREFDK
ncbi:hypothetical protein ACWGNA_03015 [Brucella cytisi]|uniref:hypothetical protein n=1 Tax=Brucella cytisi TaxID=407152 RepID=UPI0035DE8C84